MNSVLHELKLVGLNGACAKYCLRVETKCRFWVLSSVVERRPYKAMVIGSTPIAPTISKCLPMETEPFEEWIQIGTLGHFDMVKRPTELLI